MRLTQKLFGTHSQHELKRIYPVIDRIESMDKEMQALTDRQLTHKTMELKER